MFVVNYKEIPESICVETRFITKAAAQQKKNQYLYSMKIIRGQVELSQYDQYEGSSFPSAAANLAATQLKTLGRGMSVSIHNKPTVLNNPTTLRSPITTASNINPQQPSFVTSTMGGGSAPLGLTISAPYSTNMMPETHSFMNSVQQTTKISAPIPMSLSNTILPSNLGQPLYMTSLEMKDAKCMTDPKPQTINKGQQTIDTTPKTSSVSTQVCCDDLDFDFELPDEIGDSMDLEDNEELGKEEFLQYVKENSQNYKNNMQECLVCGEVFKSFKQFYGHMAVHRGPKVLCFSCGQHLDHEALLKTHLCNSSKRVSRALLRCPYKRCNVVAVSRLELYDHINEHTKHRMHKCSACSKAFCTTQEFVRHLLLRAKCYTSAKRGQGRLYGMRTKSERLCRVRVFTLHTHSNRTTMVKSLLEKRGAKKNLCEICFKTFRNNFIFNRHKKRCASLFLIHYKL